MAFVDHDPIEFVEFASDIRTRDQIEIVDSISIKIENEELIRRLLVVIVTLVDPVGLLHVLPLDLSGHVKAHHSLFALDLTFGSLNQQVKMAGCQLLHALSVIEERLKFGGKTCWRSRIERLARRLVLQDFVQFEVEESVNFFIRRVSMHEDVRRDALELEKQIEMKTCDAKLLCSSQFEIQVVDVDENIPSIHPRTVESSSDDPVAIDFDVVVDSSGQSISTNHHLNSFVVASLVQTDDIELSELEIVVKRLVSRHQYHDRIIVSLERLHGQIAHIDR